MDKFSPDFVQNEIEFVSIDINRPWTIYTVSSRRDAVQYSESKLNGGSTAYEMTNGPLPSSTTLRRHVYLTSQPRRIDQSEEAP